MKLLSSFLVLIFSITFSQGSLADGCKDLPNHKALKAALTKARQQATVV